MPNNFTASYFGSLCINKWASAQRLDAALWMDSHPSDQQAAAQAIAAGWLAADRTSLKDYLDRLPPGLLKNNLASSPSEDALLDQEPTRVIDLLGKTSGPSQRRDQLLESNASAWAMTDHQAAANWVDANFTGRQRETLLAATTIGYAHTNPFAAANLAQTKVADPTTRNHACHAILRIWAAQDQSAAFRWVESLPDGPFRDEAAAELIAIDTSETKAE